MNNLLLGLIIPYHEETDMSGDYLKKKPKLSLDLSFALYILYTTNFIVGG